MKNILKKILNKKKVIKKAKVVKKSTSKRKKNSKVLKVGKNVKIIKSKKSLKKNKGKKIPIKKPIKKEKIENKNEAFRISKSNEQKPEIKKIKKQETEKKLYKVKDYIVYPKHGVGQIMEIKKINIGGIDVETYVLKFEKDKANGMEWCLLINNLT